MGLPVEVCSQIRPNLQGPCQFQFFFSILSYVPFSYLVPNLEENEKQMFVTAPVV